MWSGVVRCLRTMPITRGKIRPSELLARVAIAALACIFRASALATPPLSVQRYSLEEGLSQQAVNAIAQDTEGFMWFGTEDGLNRFDGYEFRQLRHDRGDEQSLPNGWISSLVASEDGLWIAHRRRRRRVPQRAAPASSTHPRSCATRPTCSACARWRATVSAGSGSPRATPASPSSTRAPANCGACATRPREPNSLSDNSVFSILHLRNGDTLIGTATRPRPPLRRQSRRHAHRAAAGTRRRRASRCACAR